MNDYDILDAADFTFAPFMPEREGDSGALQMATLKVDSRIQYIIKSATPELACNEFMYHKIASALGLYTQEVKLFRGILNCPYAAGIRYSPKAQKFICADADIANRHDFYRFETLYVILNEEDSEEYYIDELNRVFKLDNAASFHINYYFAGVAFSKKKLSAKTEHSLHSMLMHTEYAKYNILHRIIIDKHGEEAGKVCMEMYERFAAFDETLLDAAYKTLDSIYPSWLSDYYCEFIQIRKAECERFVREKGLSQ